MIESKETYDKISKVLEERGPSLPMHVSKGIEMSSLFVSAFLSEMVNAKMIKVSHLKVGGSPLYYLNGQEGRLEDFSGYLHPKEHEAFLLLKEKRAVRDTDLDPAIRVAIRSIRDFVVGFKIGEEIYWRHILVPEENAKEILGFGTVKEVKPKKEARSVKLNVKKGAVKGSSDKKEFYNPVVMKDEKPKKKKAKSEFVLRVIDFINKKGLKIVEERDFKVKEYNCIVRIGSELGAMDFLCQAKDKKIVSEGDLKKLLSNAQSIPLPAFMISTGVISKKAKEFVERYRSVLKFKGI